MEINLFDLSFKDTLALSLIFAAAYGSALLLGLGAAWLKGWVDDFETEYHNPVLILLGGRATVLRRHVRRSCSEDRKVEAVTGSVATDDRELTDEQRKELFEKHPELFEEIVKEDVLIFKGVLFALIPVMCFLFVNAFWATFAITSFVVSIFIARLSKRTYKKLKKHMTDPNAHKATSDVSE